jgi:predicted negative regulator of RcsB-dependent stress response
MNSKGFSPQPQTIPAGRRWHRTVSQEVSVDPHIAEDEELHKLKEWWKRNGTSIIVGIVVGLSAIVGVNGWDWYSTRRAETASALYFQLRNSIAQGNLPTSLELARELRDDFKATPYAANGALMTAAVTFAQGDTETARELLEWVLANPGDDNIAHTARLRLAYLELSTGNHARALELASVPDVGTYGSHYAELRADAHVLAGDSGKALSAYDEAIAGLSPLSDHVAILTAKRNSVAGAD